MKPTPWARYAGLYQLWYVLLCCALLPCAAQAAMRSVPEARLIDQDGRKLAFHHDLVQGKTAVINFIFTTCTMLCPTQSATLREVQRNLGPRVGRDIVFISLSIDPVTDQPARLKEFAQRFNSGPGWHFLTGSKPEVDTLLRALGAASGDKNEHSGMLLIINQRNGVWQQLSNLPSSEVIQTAIEQAAAEPAHTPNPNPKTMPTFDSPLQAAVKNYFPNAVLQTQDGAQVRFYDDVLKDKVVLINFMFTTCPGICPPMMANLAKVQPLLSPKVQMVSITVDPETDTPVELKKFADMFQVKPGWLLLTGSQANVDAVRHKLGGYSADKNAHNAVFLAGNMLTGEWKKLVATAAPKEIAAQVNQLLPQAE